jgi:hypothetical protein
MDPTVPGEARSRDWKSLSQQPEDPKMTELTERREALAREIDDTTKVLGRYEAILDDPDSAGLERVLGKYNCRCALAAPPARAFFPRGGGIGRGRKQPRCIRRYGRSGVYRDRTVLVGTPVTIALADRAAH